MVKQFELERFIEAQDSASVFQRALSELQAGRKESHWMWFVFPQVQLGNSPTSIKYSLHSLGEARAYLNNSVLGERLSQAILASMEHCNLSAVDIFGEDAPKFHASLTLFKLANDQLSDLPSDALKHFFDGQLHQETIDWLDRNDR